MGLCVGSEDDIMGRSLLGSSLVQGVLRVKLARGLDQQIKVGTFHQVGFKGSVVCDHRVQRRGGGRGKSRFTSDVERGGMRQIFDEGFWKFGLGRGSIGMLERGMLEVDKAKVSLECGKAEE